MKRVRKEHHEDHVDESWLLPYSDMMTLLLALFIVMFAISSVDKEKYNALMSYMYTAFGGAVEAESAQPPYPPALPEAGSMDELATPDMSPPLKNVYQSLNDYIESNDLSGVISVEYEGDGLLVVLKSDVFFESGSASLSDNMKEEAHMLSTMLYDNQKGDRSFDVIVAGHTDDMPINSGKFPSNWHLSVQRAVNFMTEMLDGSSLDPTHFSSRGYGEFRPVADNSTAEGRQKNRRIEVLITEEVANNRSGGSMDDSIVQ